MSQTECGQIRAPEPNLNLGILIGLLLTDGCITKNKKGSVQIKLTTKSDELHTLFREQMEKNLWN
jgi:hypothetical protein